MSERVLWQPPQLRTDEDEEKERKATWLELFFDLVFVAIVAELAHTLSQNVSLKGVAQFVLLFIPIWWVWIGSTFYNERFENDDLSHRFFTFLQMVPVVGLAIFVRDGLGKTSTGFALSYVGARIILIFLWFRGGWHNPEARPMTNRYAIGFSISVLLWMTSIFIPAPGRFYLWTAGLLIDLLTPITTLDIQTRLPRLSTSHLPERFGLFTIIVLGESVIGVVAGMAKSHELTVSIGITGILGMTLAFSLWWIYFDNIMGRWTRPGLWWTLMWSYTHLILVMSLAAIGASVLNVVTYGGEILSGHSRWLITGSLAVGLISMDAIEFTLKRERQLPVSSRIFRTCAVALILILGLLSKTLTSESFLGLLVLVCISRVGYDTYLQSRIIDY